MVVTEDTQGADASFNQELGEDTLDLGLARLKIVTADKGLALFSKLKTPRNESILRCAVNERDALEDATNCKDGGRSNFRMAFLDALQEIFGGVIDTGDDIGVPLRIGGPDDDNLVQSMLILECVDVVANMLNMGPLVVARDQIVSATRLIGGDKRGVVDGGKRLVLTEILGDLTLKIPVEDFGTSHCGSQVKGADIPPTEDKIIGMDHGKKSIDRSINVITMDINTKFHGRRLSDAAVVVGFNESVFVTEADFVTVGCDRGSQSATIVTTPANHHKTRGAKLAKIQDVTGLPDARNNRVGFELILSLCGFDDKFAGLLGDDGIFINILGKNVIMVISDVTGRDVDSRLLLQGGFGSERRFVSSRRRVINGERRHRGQQERR